MKCLILAAGYATRLYPLTKDFPKPLLTVGSKTILDWLVDDIDSLHVVDEFVVISNHKFVDFFKKWAQTKRCNINVVDDGTSSNESRLGAVKDIQFAIETLGLDDDMLIIAGDNVLDFSLTVFMLYAMKKGASAIMRYHEPQKEKLSRSGVVVVNESDLVLEMEEKPKNPKSNWCSPPFYYYTRQDAALIKKGIAAGCSVDAPGSYIAWLCKQSKVYAMEMPGKRYDIGNIESYNDVVANYKGIELA